MNPENFIFSSIKADCSSRTLKWRYHSPPSSAKTHAAGKPQKEDFVSVDIAKLHIFFRRPLSAVNWEILLPGRLSFFRDCGISEVDKASRGRKAPHNQPGVPENRDVESTKITNTYTEFETGRSLSQTSCCILDISVICPARR